MFHNLKTYRYDIHTYLNLKLNPDLGLLSPILVASIHLVNSNYLVYSQHCLPIAIPFLPDSI